MKGVIEEIRPGIFVNQTAMGITCGAIVTEEGAAVIDLPPFPDEAAYWLDMVTHLAGRPPRYLILTDGQIERVVQASRFSGTIIVHAATAGMLALMGNRYPPSLLNNLITRRPEYGRELLVAPILKPTLTFEDEMSVQLGPGSIHLTHSGGPTHGNVLVRVQGRQVTFTGDIVVAETRPTLGEGLTINWLESLNRLRQQDFEAEVLIPGRGPAGGQLLVEPVIAYLRRARSLAWARLREEIGAEQWSAMLDELVDMFPHAPTTRTIVRENLQASLEHLYNEIQFEAIRN